MAADLEQEVSRVATAHARLVRAAERKLRDFGVPTEELGFVPVVSGASGKGGSGGIDTRFIAGKLGGGGTGGGATTTVVGPEGSNTHGLGGISANQATLKI